MTPSNIALQAPLSMELLQARILPCPPPGDLPNPGIKPKFPALRADSLPSNHQRSPKFTIINVTVFKKENDGGTPN